MQCTGAFRVDLANLPPDIKLTWRGDRGLIVPEKSKHTWEPGERHLRSLVVDAAGYVLSAGFPKFFNMGERPEIDAAFREALAQRSVAVREKLDGSLVIADIIDGKVHLRTRGNFDLGEFAPAVMALIDCEYPTLLADLRRFGQGHLSYLFEYVGGPQIVLRYERPELVYLGHTDKRTLAYGVDLVGVALAPAMRTPPSLHYAGLAELVADVRAWQGREGVVGCFARGDGSVELVKLKADEYVRLHSLRFHLTGRKAAQLACLLDVTEPTEFVEALGHLGIDYETAQFAVAQAVDYFERVATIGHTLDHWEPRFAKLAGDFKAGDETWIATPRGQPLATATGKKGFVVSVTRELRAATNDHYNMLFHYACMVYDNKPTAQFEQAEYAWALGEPVANVRRLLANREASIAALFKQPVPEDQ